MPKGAPGLRCSFCGKRSEDVEKMIAGSGVYICSECVELCGAILAEERGKAPPPVLVPQADSYRLHVAQRGGPDIQLEYPLPLGASGVHLRVVTRGGPWAGPCPACGGWTRQAEERITCFHCGQALPLSGSSAEHGTPPPEDGGE